jgi:4-oxalocrotonate tautomerase
MRLKHPAVEPKCDSSATKEDAIMPLVRIDISKTASRERVRDVGNAVYNAMIAVANVPEHDRFQVVTRHEPDEIIYPEEGYLGIDYTPELIIIQVTWVGGRSIEAKKKFY